MEDYACVLASLDASERLQVQTNSALEEHASKVFKDHLLAICKPPAKFDALRVKDGRVIWSAELAGDARREGGRIFARYKGTTKPFYLNVLNPILVTLLNKDGTVPSGKSREDLLKEVLQKMWDEEQRKKQKSTIKLDENGVDRNGVHHHNVMPPEWKGPVHFYGWSMIGPLSPTVCNPAFSLSAGEASQAARAAPIDLEDGGDDPMQDTAGGNSAVGNSAVAVVGNGTSSRAHQRKIVQRLGTFANGGSKPLQCAPGVFDPAQVLSRAPDRSKSESQVGPKNSHVVAANILADAEKGKMLLEMNAQRVAERTRRIDELKLLLSLEIEGTDDYSNVAACAYV